MSNFRPTDRKTAFLMPPSIEEWLPERHLARFIVEVIEGLDLGTMSRSYRGSGSASYHPTVLLAILVYGYATGVFSSRKLERATPSMAGEPNDPGACAPFGRPPAGDLLLHGRVIPDRSLGAACSRRER